jgi:hypothetical protein
VEDNAGRRCSRCENVKRTMDKDPSLFGHSAGFR